MADDYSPTIKSAADKMFKRGGDVKRTGSLIGRLHEGVNVPRANPPKSGDDTPPKAGTTVVDGHPVANWIVPIVKYARKHGWHGVVTSGYRSPAEQRAACRNLCGNPNGCPGTCAKPGESNHQYTAYPRGAVDVTDYTRFGEVVQAWGGFGSLTNDLPKDRVHFSHDGH